MEKEHPEDCWVRHDEVYAVDLQTIPVEERLQLIERYTREKELCRSTNPSLFEAFEIGIQNLKDSLGRTR